MEDDDLAIKSIYLKPGTHYVSNLEPCSLILVPCFFAPWREESRRLPGMDRNYEPMEKIFREVIDRTLWGRG
jgi:hypothetical protein